MTFVSAIEVLLPASFEVPAALRAYHDDDETAVEVALCHEFDLLDVVAACIDLDHQGRPIDIPFALISVAARRGTRPATIRATQDRVAEQIARLLGLDALAVHPACRPFA